MEYATLLVHRKQNQFGRIVDTFQWQGSRFAPVMVSRRLAEELSGGECPQTLNLGGYPLRFVEDDRDAFLRNAIVYARTDGLSWFAWAYWFLYRLLRPIPRSFYSRIILTLNVWGLAYTAPSQWPSWRDIGRRG